MYDVHWHFGRAKIEQQERNLPLNSELVEDLDFCSFSTCSYPVGKLGSTGVECLALAGAARTPIESGAAWLAVCGCPGEGVLPCAASGELLSAPHASGGWLQGAAHLLLQPGSLGGEGCAQVMRKVRRHREAAKVTRRKEGKQKRVERGQEEGVQSRGGEGSRVGIQMSFDHYLWTNLISFFCLFI